jgi:hypothetical protein
LTRKGRLGVKIEEAQPPVAQGIDKAGFERDLK